MSEAAPTVIFLEDVHWADDSSLDMLNRMARRIPEQSLLIVCVARHRLYERRPNWGEGLAYHRRLELQLLSKHDSSQLVTEILQMVDQVPNALQELVVKGAEGNPFYIEELIKMLIEDGVILTGEEKWQVEPERLADIEVPDTLTGVLQARLEGLPPEERNTLQQASVVGHIFWDDAVEYIRNESAPAGTQSSIRTTESNLSSLRTRELIYHREESTFTDAAEYTFKHAVLRDVTYDSVLKRVRKAYHGLVAKWLIQHSGERAGEYTGLIADHLELAGKYEQAAIYLWQAGGGSCEALRQ
jgi:predicted ATPase